MIDEGIYYNLSSDEYHADKESISRSSIMDFKKSPRYYWAKHINPERPAKEMTRAQIFGAAFHALVLETNLFLESYVTDPQPVLLKDVGRCEYEKYKTEIQLNKDSGKIILTQEESERLLDMEYALFEENKKAPDLIYDGIYESSYFWKDPESGLMLKARPDILHENIYVDLKTTNDASPEAFQRSMATYGNHIQAAMVCDGVFALTGRKLSACINICVETQYPYSVGIYIIDEEAIEYGRQEYKRLCLDLVVARDYNEYKDYPIQTIGLPRWYL